MRHQPIAKMYTGPRIHPPKQGPSSGMTKRHTNVPQCDREWLVWLSVVTLKKYGYDIKMPLKVEFWDKLVLRCSLPLVAPVLTNLCNN